MEEQEPPLISLREYISTILQNPLLDLNKPINLPKHPINPLAPKIHCDHTTELPLHELCCHENMEDLIKILLEKGARPEITNIALNNALHLCALCNATDSYAKIIIESTCKKQIQEILKHKNGHKRTPLDLAFRKGRLWAIPLFLKHYPQKISSSTIQCIWQSPHESKELSIVKKSLRLALENEINIQECIKVEKFIAGTFLGNNFFTTIYNTHLDFQTGVIFQKIYKDIRKNPKKSKSFLSFLPTDIASQLLNVIIFGEIISPKPKSIEK